VPFLLAWKNDDLFGLCHSPNQNENSVKTSRISFVFLLSDKVLKINKQFCVQSFGKSRRNSYVELEDAKNEIFKSIQAQSYYNTHFWKESLE
jgi:hypothetical protein